MVDTGKSRTKPATFSQISYRKEGSDGVAQEQQEHLYKVLVIGDFGVGKCRMFGVAKF